MIQIKNLTKYYGKKRVLDLDSLEIEKGEIFGLLGPNAAGKTTTIRILSTLLDFDSGEVEVAGLNLASQTGEIKKKIGYVAQYFGLYAELSVLENIRFYGGLYGVDQDEIFEEMVRKYQLEKFKDAKAGTLSGGYQRRLAIACALTHDPDIVFLDEPTAGIDPGTRKNLWDIFYQLSQEGKTLFVTTHYMEEAMRCHHIAFLNYGSIIAQGSPKSVADSLENYDVLVYEGGFRHEMIKLLEKEFQVHMVNQFGTQLRLIVHQKSSYENLEKIMQPFCDEKVHLQKTSSNLEDVFIALTQGDDNGRD